MAVIHSKKGAQRPLLAPFVVLRLENVENDRDSVLVVVPYQPLVGIGPVGLDNTILLEGNLRLAKPWKIAHLGEVGERNGVVFRSLVGVGHLPRPNRHRGPFKDPSLRIPGFFLKVILRRPGLLMPLERVPFVKTNLADRFRVTRSLDVIILVDFGDRESPDRQIRARSLVQLRVFVGR